MLRTSRWSSVKRMFVYIAKTVKLYRVLQYFFQLQFFSVFYLIVLVSKIIRSRTITLLCMKNIEIKSILDLN